MLGLYPKRQVLPSSRTPARRGAHSKRVEALKRSGIKLFNANTATLLASLQAGAQGYSGVMGNFHPDLYVWLCRHYLKAPESRSFRLLLTCMSLIENCAYPVCAKYHMNRLGLPLSLASRTVDPCVHGTASSGHRSAEGRGGLLPEADEGPGLNRLAPMTAPECEKGSDRQKKADQNNRPHPAVPHQTRNGGIYETAS